MPNVTSGLGTQQVTRVCLQWGLGSYVLPSTRSGVCRCVRPVARVVLSVKRRKRMLRVKCRNVGWGGAYRQPFPPPGLCLLLCKDEQVCFQEKDPGL